MYYGGLFVNFDMYTLVVSTFMATDNGAVPILMSTDGAPDQQLPMKGISRVTKLFHLRRLIKDGPLPLVYLLLECAASVITQPEDKVFALQGISNATENRELQPDYSKPFQEIYKEATLYAIKNGSLSLLTMGGIAFPKSPQAADLPSWTADLSSPSPLLPLKGAVCKYEAGITRSVKFYYNSLDSTLKIDGVYSTF